MEQLIVNDLDTEVEEKLRQRAEQNGRSLEDEVKAILGSAVAERVLRAEDAGLGTRMAQRFAGIGVDLDLTGFRGRAARGTSFAE